MPSPGERYGEYRLLAPIGSGGDAQVWRAQHWFRPERIVAVKVGLGPGGARALRREAEVAAAASGPGLVGPEALGLDHDPPYLVLEYFPGGTLRDLLDRRGALPVPQAVEAARRLAAALGLAHRRGTCHLDVKPENVLVDREGGVRLADFGCASTGPVEEFAPALRRSDTQLAGSPARGTVSYMAPERRQGAPADPRADVYSLGVVLYEMLVGQGPEGLDLPGERVPGVPGALDALVKACLSADPRRRPADGEGLALCLAAASAPPAPPAGRSSRWPRLTALARRLRAALASRPGAAALPAPTWRLLCVRTDALGILGRDAASRPLAGSPAVATCLLDGAAGGLACTAHADGRLAAWGPDGRRLSTGFARGPAGEDLGGEEGPVALAWDPERGEVLAAYASGWLLCFDRFLAPRGRHRLDGVPVALAAGLAGLGDGRLLDLRTGRSARLHDAPVALVRRCADRVLAASRHPDRRVGSWWDVVLLDRDLRPRARRPDLPGLVDALPWEGGWVLVTSGGLVDLVDEALRTRGRASLLPSGALRDRYAAAALLDLEGRSHLVLATRGGVLRAVSLEACLAGGEPPGRVLAHTPGDGEVLAVYAPAGWAAGAAARTSPSPSPAASARTV